MYEIAVKKDRIRIELKAFLIGDDLCVMVYGGDSPHIGAVTFSVPRPSLMYTGVNSSSTSVLTRTGHKDDELARQLSGELASKLNRNVVTTCGIHMEYITSEEIRTVGCMVMELVDNIVKYVTDCEICNEMRCTS